MTQNQYRLEDFKIGQKVKVLVDLGTYVNDSKFSRLNQVGTIFQIDDVSVRVLFDNKVNDKGFTYKDQWYKASEIELVITSNSERQERIDSLEIKIQELTSEINELRQEIKDNPEKIKAKVGDKVRFKYKNDTEWSEMFIMTKEQAATFGRTTTSNFHFIGVTSGNPISTVINGSHVELQFCPKEGWQWIDAKDGKNVDWSDLL